MVGPFLHGGAPASRVPDPPALYLSASEFYDQSLAFVDGLPDTSLLLPTFRDHRAAWVERGIPFCHDWEAALTPVVDVLVARGDVDGAALLGYAIGQAGYWLPWALAFERRLLAAVVDGGVVDVARAWSVNLPPVLLATLRAGDRDGFNAAVGAAPRIPPASASSPSGPSPTAARRSTTPSRRRSASRWTGSSREQGANFQCQPLARGLTGHVMCDFLAEHLARVRAVPARG